MDPAGAARPLGRETKADGQFHGTIFKITGSGFVSGIVPRAGNKVISTFEAATLALGC